MKKFLLLALASGLLAALTGCGVHFASGGSDADLTATTNVIQTAAIPANLKGLKVDNRFGAIDIIGADTTNTWTWKLVVRARTAGVAQQIASAARCEVELQGDQLNLVVSLPDTQEPHSYQSDFEIRVPSPAAIQTQNRFGSTEIAGVAGNVAARGENGRMEIRDIGGSVNAENSFDSLSVHHAGPATLKSQNGRLEAVNIAGTLEAETSFDSLVARDISGAATLRDQNGRIEAAGIGGSLDAKTSFDSLTARDIAGPAHLRDQNGRITTTHVKGDADIETSFDSLSVEGVGGNAILKNQNGRVEASGVTGSVKADTSFDRMEITGAGSKFVCHNQNGAIHLRATSTALTAIEAETSFDTLEVHLPAALKPAIQAHTTFAEVVSDFPVLTNPPGDDTAAEAAPDTTRIRLQNQNGKIAIARD